MVQFIIVIFMVKKDLRKLVCKLWGMCSILYLDFFQSTLAGKSINVNSTYTETRKEKLQRLHCPKSWKERKNIHHKNELQYFVILVYQENEFLITFSLYVMKKSSCMITAPLHYKIFETVYKEISVDF
jgi:hypothetical protein